MHVNTCVRRTLACCNRPLHTQNFYPFNFILPTGDMYSQIDNLVRFYKPDGE